MLIMEEKRRQKNGTRDRSELDRRLQRRLRTQEKDIQENGESSVSAEKEKGERHGPFDSVAKGQS